MDENKRELNNDRSVSPEQQDIYNEIIESADEMAQSFFDSGLSREEILRREAENKEKLEMEAIRADIERRYSAEVEETMRSVEHISSADGGKPETAKLEEIINLESFTESAPVKKKKKRRVKRRKKTRFIDLDEKNSIYRFTYILGDLVAHFFKLVFGTLFGFIAAPFIRMRTSVKDEIISRRMSNALNESAIEAKAQRRQTRASFRNIFRSLRHPLSTPAVILHYLRKSFGRPVLRTALNYMLPLAAVALLILTFSYWKNVTFALKVIYNNESIGYISDESVFIEAKDMVLDRLSSNSITSEQTTGAAPGNLNAGYELAVVSYDKLNDARTISDKMIENSAENLTHACGIYIDGRFICALKNEADAKTVFYKILAPHEDKAEENGYVVSILQEIEYVQGLYPDDRSIMWEANELESYIEENELINIKKSVSTSEVVEVPYPTVTTRDITKYSGYRVVRQEGISGKKRVTTTHVYIDNELSTTYTTDEVIIAPQEEIIVIGTKTTYGGVYIGQASSMGFLWPAPHCHYISSPYGWRSSGWHKGVDLCTSNGTARGTPVIASRSGVVEVVQRSSSGYGNMVLINHGDGYKTRYAHLLEGSITVRIGETVEGGKTIGRVGSTGNSSGPHLHFEVIYNGETQNPVNFIS